MYSEISPATTLPEISPIEVDPILVEVINGIGAKVLYGAEVRMAEEEPVSEPAEPEPAQEPPKPQTTPSGLPVRAPDPGRETPGTTTRPGEQESDAPQIDDPRAI